jgi:sulfopyruvate decarboxylase TPP-binding subunit
MNLVLSAKKIIEQLHFNNVTHVVWLPDSETNFMYSQLSQDASIKIVSVSREGETMPIAAGLWAGGKKPVVMIQNTGLFESGDSIRGMTIDLKFPLVIFVGYRGWKRKSKITDSAAKFTLPILNAWGIKSYLIEQDLDCELISDAFVDATKSSFPVACLIGAEYSS